MDYRLQLKNLTSMSDNLSNFCRESLDDWEENDTAILSKKEQEEEIEYTLNNIHEQIQTITNMCDINNKRDYERDELQESDTNLLDKLKELEFANYDTKN